LPRAALRQGRGGPGGWWIIDERELHFLVDVEVDVLDIAGWRRERMPKPPHGHRFTVVPDWICAVLSPSTESKDRDIKMPIYSRYGVAHTWLVDLRKRQLETYDLVDGAWQESGRYSGAEVVRATPFAVVALALNDLWAD
jgi:Uma2 family endonuclease